MLGKLHDWFASNETEGVEGCDVLGCDTVCETYRCCEHTDDDDACNECADPDCTCYSPKVEAENEKPPEPKRKITTEEYLEK